MEENQSSRVQIDLVACTIARAGSALLQRNLGAVWEPWHASELPWLLALGKPGAEIGEDRCSYCIQSYDTGCFVLFLLKVVNCHFSPKL